MCLTKQSISREGNLTNLSEKQLLRKLSQVSEWRFSYGCLSHERKGSHSICNDNVVFQGKIVGLKLDKIVGLKLD